MNILTQQNWPELVTASPLPVFVIYHSPFSAPSRRSLKLLLDLEPQFPPIRFGSVNVDAEDALTAFHGIVSIPAFVIYRAGKAQAHFRGEWSEKRLVEKIGKALA